MKITETQLADKWGVSQSMLRTRRARYPETIPTFSQNGPTGSVYYEFADVLAWEAEHGAGPLELPSIAREVSHCSCAKDPELKEAVLSMQETLNKLVVALG